MATQDFKRKLTAMLSADVKGYSQLMGQDEVATVRNLTAYRQVIAMVIQKHYGRVVDSPGDNLLAEFASVVDAVRCAVEIQEELKDRNAALPENLKMEFRIGVNLADVIQDGERIYGNGVNLTARVQSLAAGGGICISRNAYDQVKNKLALGYEYLGAHSVKNIAEPLRVYRVLMEPEAADKVISERKPRLSRGRRVALAVVIALLMVAGGMAFWESYLGAATPQVEIASQRETSFPLLDKPSIAVLPFTNISGDPEEEYFADGLTDDLITGLSKISGLFVIARNSTFAYKGKPVKIRLVAKELGVRYVLEGSVYRVGNSVRINTQLIDPTTGYHLWAERYDGNLDDIFALQERLTRRIVAALAVTLTTGKEYAGRSAEAVSHCNSPEIPL